MTRWGHAANLGWKGITWKLTQRVTRVSVGFNYSKSHLCETRVGGKMKLRYFFFFFFIYIKLGFIFNSDSHRLYETCARSDSYSVRKLQSIDSSQKMTDSFYYTQNTKILYIYIYTHARSNLISCSALRSIPRNFRILGDLRASIKKTVATTVQNPSKLVVWILDWRRREDPTTAARLSVFLARLSAENTDEFRSRNPPGLAPRGQTSKGLGTLGRRWIEARLLGCRLASARRSSLRVAGQPTASSTVGLQPPSG